MFDPTQFALQVPGLDAAQTLYLTGEDALLLGVFNSAAGVTVALTGRFLPVPLPGDVQPPRVRVFQHNLIPTTNRTLSTLAKTLGEGWLLDGAVQIVAGNPSHGQCYATVSLQRGDTGATLTLSALARDYVTVNQRLGIVNNQFTGMADGAGAIRSITGSTPAAGAEISETVPANARWDLIAFHASFATAVAAGTRNTILTLDDGANVYDQSPANNNQGPSATDGLNWGQGQPYINGLASQGLVASIPNNLRLGAGHRIRTSTVAIQAADQYSAVQYLVREWIEAN